MTVTNETLAVKIDALDEKIEDSIVAHQREHEQHDKAHAREHDFTAEALRVAASLAKENKEDANEWRGTMDDRESSFATKEDVRVIGGKIDALEKAEIRRAETEKLRLSQEAEDKRLSERRADADKQETARRVSRSQWMVGIIVGLLSTFGAILVSTVIRLATT